MDDRDVAILVPGLLGFSRFGTPPDSLDYFDQVAERLVRDTGCSPERFIVASPPPTGALQWRVRSLFNLILRLIEEGYPAGREIGRVYLIGHSTGGCDIRMLLNERFTWPDPPSAAQRERVIERVEKGITLSAPLQGTPIARRLRGTMEAAIPALFALSVLGKREPGATVRDAVAMIRMMKGPLAQGEPLRAVISAALPPATAAEVLTYLDHIIADHELIHDLTVFAMQRLNEAVAGGDRKPLRCYVSVAPAPAVRGALEVYTPVRALQTAVYSFAYWNTRPDAAQVPGETGPFPQGAWIGEMPSRPLASEYASDGVVTACSQTIDGTAAGLVEGDHLDVVGHYASREFHGVSVFRSGAHFDDVRFNALWKAIAADLEPAVAQAMNRAA